VLVAPPKSDFVKKEQVVRPAPVGEFIKPIEQERVGGR
jgi:hypothetical protein